MIPLGLAAATVVDATRSIPAVSTEALAMGSAGRGFAYGANGLLLQPAATAVRKTESKGWASLSLTVAAELVGTGAALDVSNLGTAEAPPGSQWKLGAVATFRHWGLGIVSTGLSLQDAGTALALTETHLGGGASLFDGRLAIGAGWRLLELQAGNTDGRIDWAGSGFETGIMGTALGPGFNGSLVVRTPVFAPATSTHPAVPGLDGARVPWQFALGAGWASRQSPWTLPFPLRATLDLVLDCAVDDGIAPESILVGQAIPRGRTPTLTPHLGAEAEPWNNRLRLRAGGWLEPARSATGNVRLHGTGGAELRLFKLRALGGKIDVDLSWEVGADLAARYRQFAWLGLGFWSGGLVGYENLSAP